MVLQITLEVLAVALVVITIGLLSLILRRRFLQRRLRTFDCSVRLERAERGKGWSFGVARYRGDSVEWFRVFSFSARPRCVFVRRDLQVHRRRVPDGPEVYAMLANALVLECSVGGRPVELAMSSDAIMGFMSWLEAAPPGQHLVA